MAVGIIVKNYSHYNRALGTYVKNKDHYDRLMKEGGYVSQEENDQRVKNSKDKPFELSKNAWDIIKAAKNSKDKSGKVNLGDKTIDAMIGIGAIKKQKIPSYMQLPAAYQI